MSCKPSQFTRKLRRQNSCRCSIGRFPGLAFIKPLLWALTTIDFGQLTYESELEQLLKRADGLTILQSDVIPGSVNNRFQAARMVVLRVDSPSSERSNRPEVVQGGVGGGSSGGNVRRR
jgi:hypothetical protein